MGELITPKGGAYLRVPVVEVHGLRLPIRELNPKAIEQLNRQQVDARALTLGLLTQVTDQNNLLWAGLLSLAKDIYERDPINKTRHFQSFAEEVGLRLSDGETSIDVAKELGKI